MTLTSLMPSLRRSIPDPLNSPHWPEHTVATTSDVIVAAVSMTQLAKLVGTPLVHLGDEVHALDGVAHTPDGHCSVVVTTVTSIRTMPSGHIELTLDIDQACPGLELSEARLIGRSSVFPAAHTRVHTVGDVLRHASDLPDDVAVGDLVAVPWPGTHVVREVHAVHALPPVAPASAAAD
jgi:hypothetical protein